MSQKKNDRIVGAAVSAWVGGIFMFVILSALFGLDNTIGFEGSRTPFLVRVLGFAPLIGIYFIIRSMSRSNISGVGWNILCLLLGALSIGLFTGFANSFDNPY